MKFLKEHYIFKVLHFCITNINFVELIKVTFLN